MIMVYMGYCRFENCAKAMEDCLERWDNIPDEAMIQTEKEAREMILSLCRRIVDQFGK